MRIGIEAQRIQRKKKHGMDIVAVETIRALQALDTVNEYFIFVKADEDKSVIQETANFKVIELPGKSYIDWELFSIPKAVKQFGIDVLHCTSNTAPWFVKIPLMVTVHDIIYLEKLHFRQGTWYQKLGNVYRRWNVPKVMRRAQRILTVSNFENTNIRQKFPNEASKVFTVYNAASGHFKPILDQQTLDDARAKFKLPPAYIFFLGNTDPKKNVANVLEAYRDYRKESPSALPLVMPDLDKGFLQQIVQSLGAPELLDHIQLTGYIPNQELPLIYALSTYFLYPSKRESFGIPILEAMQCGKAVITSNTSSMPEIAGGAALLVDPLRAEDIKNAMLRLEGDPELRNQLAEKGLERSKAFSWTHSAQQVLTHYQELVS
ncbi:MAG: glycosyltransferase family 4 protein [Bacteroidota bacterium]|nr:glycosyltransferase family 4 protein [Bacteroidota bacterium]MDX5429873.1 glycosyltransferase family 4 protein [Bacteroidota bacterium]MDX5468651.1 glycosyltransferase family 4 protein [Bacteroidota bacterium]